MYSDVFCKVYNEFGWNYYPEIFGQQLLQWLRQRGIRPQTSMDLACGTGDALNHIGNLADVEQIFQNVYAYTSAGVFLTF